MKKGKNIEDIFKEGFDNYEVDPGNQLWTNIQSQISMPNASAANASVGKTISIAGKSVSTWLAAAVVGGAIVVGSIGAYLYFDDKEDKSKEISQEIITEPTPSSDKKETQLSSKDSEESNSDNEENNISDKQENSLTENHESAEKDSSPNKVAQDSKKKITNTTPSNNKGREFKSTYDAEESNSEFSEKAENIGNKQANSEVTSLEKETTDATSSGTSASTSNQKTKSQKSNQDNMDHNLEPDDPNANPIDPPNMQNETTSFADIERFKPMNAFSPNGDGINDIFSISRDSLDAMKIEALEVSIFTPSGRLIRKWNDLYGFWDGMTSSGVKASEGTYFYRMILTREGKEVPKQGTITLTK